MAKKGKRYLEAAKKVDPRKIYTRDEAIELVKEVANAKFDETVEVAIKLGVDPRHADQQVRGTVVLPHGLGKEMKVLVLLKATKLKKHRLGDFVGDESCYQIQGDGQIST